ncbi:DUF4268 domain-containing protein [Pontibacter sp. HSC-36F09]|uniref:DUF4268 domain-containing protein n=1 Tax=Pontibacter sp. HSC-36F09 TaxID=2910966 RepID=UPI0020A0C533|nr:DUF4268 domain-containing protein [Pontibacter sp. HSC-36F09]MCP2044875.1 hypothetical protein [Pontibacter sp. HSC-36F09]
MYTREQASKLRQAFWTAFGQYMSPVLSAEGIPTNWINYKTGLKNVYFRMQADKKQASIAIEMTQPDPEIQQMFFEQFEALKELLHDTVGEEWTWDLHTTDEYGKEISRIYTELKGVSVFKQDDWPALISFFKPRIVALDAFWNDAKYSFDELR